MPDIAKILDGKEESDEIIKKLKCEVKKLSEEFSGCSPGLAIIQVGDSEDSNIFIRMNIKAAKEIGIMAQHRRYPMNLTQQQLIQKIKMLNEDPKIHGMIVQLPLDSENKIDSDLIVDSVSKDKDVDGQTIASAGRLSFEGFLPCTPNVCMEFIKRSGATIAGANAVVLCGSKIVGTPMAELLKWHHATVTTCHYETAKLDDVVRSADILVVDIGRAEMIKGSWVKPGAVVIDCGINSIADSTKKSGQRLVGDVNFQEVSKVASFITPVPGGVGPMTVAKVMQNTVIAYKNYIFNIMAQKCNMTFSAVSLLDHVSNTLRDLVSSNCHVINYLNTVDSYLIYCNKNIQPPTPSFPPSFPPPSCPPTPSFPPSCPPPPSSPPPSYPPPYYPPPSSPPPSSPPPSCPQSSPPPSCPQSSPPPSCPQSSPPPSSPPPSSPLPSCHQSSPPPPSCPQSSPPSSLPPPSCPISSLSPSCSPSCSPFSHPPPSSSPSSSHPSSSPPPPSSPLYLLLPKRKIIQRTHFDCSIQEPKRKRKRTRTNSVTQADLKIMRDDMSEFKTEVRNALNKLEKNMDKLLQKPIDKRSKSKR